MKDPNPTIATYQWGKEERIFHSVVPPLELLAMGAVATNWGHFENWFGNFFTILRWKPEVAAIEPKPRREFNNRVRHFRDAVAVALPNCPVLSAKLNDICDRAVVLSGKRNDAAHGIWFSFDGETTVSMSLDGTKEHYTVTVAQLFELARRIEALRGELVWLQMCYLDPEYERIPLPERRAWQDHVEHNRPTPPTDRSRPPRRKPLIR